MIDTKRNTYNGNNCLTVLDYLFFDSMIEENTNEKIYSKDCAYELKKSI